MKIYTKTGDSGTTGLFAGPRVPKDDVRISAYGSVDELNSILGVVISSLPPELANSRLSENGFQTILLSIQSDLFALGAELATPAPEAHGMRLLTNHRISEIEATIDAVEGELPPLQSFILPGGSQAAAHLHHARTVCRRAERHLVSLLKQPEVADYSRLLVYLNRLSDFLFVLARLANHRQGFKDIAWEKPAE